ncbi:hypothetical protein ACROYT_G027322 [Oculina patagonica]
MKIVFWEKMPVIAVLLFVSLMFWNISSQQCGIDTYSIYQMMLRGHTFKTFKTRPLSMDCREACNSDVRCQSYNYVFFKDICELNNRTKEARPEDFVKDSDRYYMRKAPNKVPLGSIPELPADSCREIKASEGGQAVSGTYWLDLEKNGNPLKFYCDMKTDGGGWLLVSNVVIDDSPPFQLSVETSYRGISNYFNNKTFLTKNAMNELRTHFPFTQLRFHCSKQHHGRTFHVTTAANSTGEAVVQYFSGQTNIRPHACGSFERLDNDDSELAGVCDKWGASNWADEDGKWGSDRDQQRLYNHAAFVWNLYHWIIYEDGSRLECDDGLVGASSGDFWKVFVR